MLIPKLVTYISYIYIVVYNNSYCSPCLQVSSVLDSAELEFSVFIFLDLSKMSDCVNMLGLCLPTDMWFNQEEKKEKNYKN